MVIKKKRKKGLSVDFSGVEAGGMSVADGNYNAYPLECTEEEGESSGEPYLKFKWKITSGKAKGATVYDNCSLQPQALWRLKTLFELWEMEADGVTDIDPDDLTGEDKEIGIEVTNEKYKGKDQPRITGFGAAASEDDDDDDDDEDDDKGKSTGKKSTSKPSKKDDDDDDDDEDEKPTKPSKKDPKVGKAPKIKEGSKVQFEDDDDKVIKGTVTEIDGDTAKVEDKKGEEWEVPLESLELQ